MQPAVEDKTSSVESLLRKLMLIVFFFWFLQLVEEPRFSGPLKFATNLGFGQSAKDVMVTSRYLSIVSDLMITDCK